MNLTFLFGVLSALVAYYFHSKLKNSQALNDNQEATKGLNKLDTSIAKNEGLLQAEEENRKNQEVPNVSQENLIDFVNKRSNDKPSV